MNQVQNQNQNQDQDQLQDLNQQIVAQILAGCQALDQTRRGTIAFSEFKAFIKRLFEITDGEVLHIVRRVSIENECVEYKKAIPVLDI